MIPEVVVFFQAVIGTMGLIILDQFTAFVHEWNNSVDCFDFQAYYAISVTWIFQQLFGLVTLWKLFGDLQIWTWATSIRCQLSVNILNLLPRDVLSTRVGAQARLCSAPY
jgi:hypothetical protein